MGAAMTDRELMQQVLDALVSAYQGSDVASQVTNSITALRARLAQPEPEPVAWFMEGTFEDGTPSFTQVCETDPEFYVPLYTAPPSGAAATQREWQTLTDEEMFSLWVRCPAETENRFAFARAIEAKLKEKNG